MSPNDDPPMTLYPDRRPALGLALLSLVGLGAGAWLSWKVGPAVGLAVAAASLLVQLGALIWLIPSRSYLHLTDRGFIACRWFNPRRVEWSDVARFGVATVGGEPRVAWDYAPHYPAECVERERTKDAVGFEAVLPPCCRMRPEPLAELLERRRRRAGG